MKRHRSSSVLAPTYFKCSAVILNISQALLFFNLETIFCKFSTVIGGIFLGSHFKISSIIKRSFSHWLRNSSWKLIFGLSLHKYSVFDLKPSSTFDALKVPLRVSISDIFSCLLTLLILLILEYICDMLL